MTTLPTDKAQAAAPGHASQPAVSDALMGTAAAGVAAVIHAGMRALDDLRAPGHEVTSGDLGRTLRAVVARHGRAVPVVGKDRLTGVVVALRVACAHLDAGNLVEARLALGIAHDALPSPHHDQHATDAATTGTDAAAGAQARAVCETEQRSLNANAVLQQAAGVLAGHSGTSPALALAALHGYAERHRFVVSELAADVVAGRVAPGSVVDPPAGREPSAGSRKA